MRTFKTLSGAVNELQPGDVIEIRSSERLPIQLAEPVMKPLAIRAGAGYRPWLVFAAPEKCEINAGLSVEGCDLDLRSGLLDAINQKSTWRFHRCRIWGDLHAGITKLRFSDSVLISIYGMYTPPDGTETDYEFDNCLIRQGHVLIRNREKIT